MMKETENILHINLDFLPLKTYTNITEGNALRIDWNDVIDKNELNYIMGNPPFIGSSMMTEQQKKEATEIFGKIRLSNSLDYVCAWYFKAGKFIQNTNIEVAFVSTNSITQGEQVVPIWGTLMERYNIQINFAYRTFIWNSEASLKAHVHCVIIGFSNNTVYKKNKRIYIDNKSIIADNISPYLLNAPNIIVDSYVKPISKVPICSLGNTAKDEGNLLLNEVDKTELIKKYPVLEKYIRRYVGGRDFLHNDENRYCLWFKGANLSDFRSIPEIRKRLEKVKEFRSNSTSKDTRLKADVPYLFFRTPHIESDYIIIPRTTSERRRYIPIGFMNKECIGSDALMVIYNANIYHFGVLISNVHSAWMRCVGGRLKSDYRYSAVIVYNTFPWCNPTDEQKQKIEKTAQAILDARALYPNSSLADLYDELTMPPELRKAHQENDKAVMEAYGFNWKKMTESDCVSELMKMYSKLVRNSEK